MPKNKTGGKKHKSKKNDVKTARTLEIPEESECIGQVTKTNGNGRFDITCQDGQIRSGILRGTMRRKVWINRLDLVLVEPWEFQNDKCSILYKYDDNEYDKLVKDKHLPKEFKLENDSVNLDEDNYFSYDISDSDTDDDHNGQNVSDEKINRNESSEEEIIKPIHRHNNGIQEIDFDLI